MAVAAWSRIQSGGDVFKTPEPQRGVRSDAALTKHDLVHAIERHAELLGGLELPAPHPAASGTPQEQLAGVDRRTKPVLTS